MFDILLNKYIENPDFEFLLITFFISFLLGYISFAIHFLIKKNKNKYWINLNLFDKIGLSLITGLWALFLSFTFHILFIAILKLIGLSILTDVNTNRIILIALAFCYLMWISNHFSNKNKSDYNYNVFYSKKGILLFAIISMPILSLIYSIQYKHLLLFIVTIIESIIILIWFIIYKKLKKKKK